MDDVVGEVVEDTNDMRRAPVGQDKKVVESGGDDVVVGAVGDPCGGTGRWSCSVVDPVHEWSRGKTYYDSFHLPHEKNHMLTLFFKRDLLDGLEPPRIAGGRLHHWSC